MPNKDDSSPVIFTVEEVERLMILAYQEAPSLIPYLALGIFTGVRPEEIRRLTWDDIGEESERVQNPLSLPFLNESHTILVIESGSI